MVFSDFTQLDGLLDVITPLEPGHLLLREFKGIENLNEPFHYELDMLSIDEYLPMREMVGKTFTVIVRNDNSLRERYFNGIVKRISQMPSEGRLVRYRVELAPTLCASRNDVEVSTGVTIFPVGERLGAVGFVGASPARAMWQASMMKWATDVAASTYTCLG